MAQPHIAQNGENSQARILRAYTVLNLLRADWSGVLILCCGLGPQGEAVALAANMAGAICLSVEERPELLKEALRAGYCDFIVNTLDEALRTMKNEARKHLPLSVGLQGNPNHVLLECLDRGVQPESILDPVVESYGEYTTLIRSSIQQLCRQGAIAFSLEENVFNESVLDGMAILDRFLREREWELRSFRLNDAAALRSFDVRALPLLLGEDSLRRRWLRSALRIVQRQRPVYRLLWATEEEWQRLKYANGRAGLGRIDKLE